MSKLADQIDEFRKTFMEIQSRGFIPSNRNHDTGIGKTFEDLMGIKENNSPLSDFKNWEIKTKRMNSGSLLTLFTLSPHPKKINSRIRKDYGYSNDLFPNTLCLMGTLSSKRITDIKGRKGTIKVDYDTDKIELILNSNPVAYWNFDALRVKTKQKLTNTILIKATTKKIKNHEHFRFDGYVLYEYKGLNAFIDALEQGIIEVDIRLGVYKSGKNIGKAHDYGTGFRIAERNLDSIFNIYTP